MFSVIIVSNKNNTRSYTITLDVVGVLTLTVMSGSGIKEDKVVKYLPLLDSKDKAPLSDYSKI